MNRFHAPQIIEQRALGGLRWLELHSPELAAHVRPGHYLLLRCADIDSADPLLRRALFVAGADGAAGTLRLLYAPDERGLRWLARQCPGAELDVIGPLGHPFELDPRGGNLLLLGQGQSAAALLALAEAALARSAAVVLLIGAAGEDLLPPPYLLPPDIEYQTGAAGLIDLLAAGGAGQPGPRLAAGPIMWADQLCAAIPEELLGPLANSVRAQRLRWRRGFAQVALDGPMPCGVGACLGCLVETRDGWRTRCRDGPVFDLKSLRAE